MFSPTGRLEYARGSMDCAAANAGARSSMASAACKRLTSSAPLLWFPVRLLLSGGHVAGSLHELAELGVGDGVRIHPEAVDVHRVRGTLVVLREHCWPRVGAALLDLGPT